MHTQRTAVSLASQSLHSVAQKNLAGRGRLVLGVALFVLLLASLAAAQDTPRLALSGTYTYVRFDSTTLGFVDRSGLQGFNTGIAFNLHPNFGVVAEVGKQYGSDLQLTQWLVGPRIYYPKWGALLFGHVLFGQGQARLDITSPVTNAGKAYAAGGGVDFPIGPRFSIRVIQAEYFRTRTFDRDQGNLRFSAGLVFRWGAVKKGKPELTSSLKAQPTF
ncbi:MAG TPA: outer membrane beta-barrel protein [Terriglobales bacterium]